jgi:hypothetical protein
MCSHIPRMADLNYCLHTDLLPLRGQSAIFEANDTFGDPKCEGLVLVPAGPNTLRRIGRFHYLPQMRFRNVSEQEVMIE